MRNLKIAFSFTSREAPSCEKYFREIKKFPLLTLEQEAAVIARIKAGDEQAVKELTQANLRFVVSVAKQYQSSKIGLGDLINDGNLGLITAAKRFDETRGFKFISYAVWWIRQSIVWSLVDESRLIRLPINAIQRKQKIATAWDKLEQAFEREPTLEELAEAASLTVEKVADSLEDTQEVWSLHAPCTTPLIDAQGGTLLDIMENGEPSIDGDLMRESLSKDIEDALLCLNERERDIIRDFFGLHNHTELPIERIAEKNHVSRERARQIKEGAVAKLQRVASKSLLNPLYA